MIGEHPKILAVFDAVREAAETDAPVLIEGESGTGKEMVARALHKQSARAKGLLVPVNCGAIPEGLLETELFGHERGAFTGAVKEHRGRFALADGGTLFLDEIGELNLAMQVKLLRVLEDGAITRIGGDVTRHVDVRVICATNRNLEREVAAGRFRADLFYRLSVLPIAVPPLREHAEDIPLLAEHILDTLANEGRCSRPRARVSDEARALLLAHDWPGNIRELENTLRYASVKAHGDVILPGHLPRVVRAGKHACAPEAFAVAQPRLLDRSRVLDALERSGGNKSKAARLLGVGRATLYRFLAKQR
jgi:transcriptional regulator with GAF, ATPase, and Fis domain